MIPVLINSRDIIASLTAQILFFREIPEADIYVIDNASTYPPLVWWMKAMDDYTLPRLHFIHLPLNLGPRAALSCLHHVPYKFDYYFLSESDLDFSTCDHHTLLPDLIAGLQRYPDCDGAGVSLQIDDLPDTELGKITQVYEGRNWKQHVPYNSMVKGAETCSGHRLDQLLNEGGLLTDPDWWVGGTDTAGVMRRTSPPWSGNYDGIRSTKHIARHRPWYFIPENWSCPECRGRYSLDPLVRRSEVSNMTCSGCRTGIKTPKDFKYYYAHANPAGTAYTSFILDGGRSKL